MNKFRINCGVCQSNGFNRVLGDLVNGTILEVQRQHSKTSIDETTIIYGEDFYICCGYCGSKLHIGKEVYESDLQRNQWIYRETLITGVVVKGNNGSANNQGTALLPH